jgi:glucose/arabinose dehydrogenase
MTMNHLKAHLGAGFGHAARKPSWALVAMAMTGACGGDGDAPATAVNWTDPTKQWSDFVSGFQLADGTTRVARPTGVAVGSAGSLFVADDQNGLVYRIRPM